MEDTETRFECSFCLEKFKDPRILTCFHTFCLKCLKTYLSKSAPGSQFVCPLCRKINHLPPEGVSGLQKNFYLEEPNEKSKSQMYTFCKDHPEEDMRFYCHNCKDTLCRDCKVIKHEGHKVEMVKDVVANMKEKLEKTFNDTETVINENENILRRNIAANLDCFETGLNVMKESSDHIIQDIQETLSIVIDLIQPHKFRENDKLAKVQSQSEQKRSKLLDYKDKLAKALSETDNQLVFKLFKDLIEENSEMKKMAEPPLLSDIKPNTISDCDIDVEGLSSVFFAFRDVVHNGLVKLKSRINGLRNSQGNNSSNILAEKKEAQLLGNGKSDNNTCISREFRGQLKYYTPGSNNPHGTFSHHWKLGTVKFSWEENGLHLNARPEATENSGVSATLQPDTIIQVGECTTQFYMKINLPGPSCTWFHFRPDQPSDLRLLKRLAVEINQFKAHGIRPLGSRQGAVKTPRPGQGGVDVSPTPVDHGTAPRNIFKSLTQNSPVQPSATTSSVKRKAPPTSLSNGKKLCSPVGSNFIAIQDTAPGKVGISPSSNSQGGSAVGPTLMSNVCDDILLFQKYPTIWTGSLEFKNNGCKVDMHFLGGNRELGRLCLPEQRLNDTTQPLRITQRLALDKLQMKGLLNSCKNNTDSCKMVAVPSGEGLMMLRQHDAVLRGLSLYLSTKNVAGIVPAQSGASEKHAFVLHVFPPGNFSNFILMQSCADIYKLLRSKSYLTAVITKSITESNVTKQGLV